MRAAISRERRTGSLLAAAIRGWAAVALGALALFVAVWLLRLAAMMPGPSMTQAEQGQAFLVFGMIAVFTLHAPLLSAGLLWLARKALGRTPGLPVWLIAGVAGCLPMAAFGWYGITAVTAHDDGTAQARPFLWTNLQLPLLALALGLIGAFIGWRWRRARLAA